MVDELRTWFENRVPRTWFEGPLEVTEDGDEILVVCNLPDVELARGTSEAARAAAGRPASTASARRPARSA